MSGEVVRELTWALQAARSFLMHEVPQSRQVDDLLTTINDALRAAEVEHEALLSALVEQRIFTRHDLINRITPDDGR